LRRVFEIALGLTSVGLLAALTAGCASASGSPVSGLGKTSLAVGAVPVADEAGLYIAQDEGLFKAEGLNAKIDSIVSSELAAQDQNNGTYDVTAGSSVSDTQDQVSVYPGPGERPVEPGDRGRGLAHAAEQSGTVYPARLADHGHRRPQGRAHRRQRAE
jgi:hypothetical protein